MGWISRVLAALCFLSGFASGSSGMKRTLAGGGGGGSCSIQPSTFFGPACYWIYKFTRPKEGGHLPFLGNAEILNYAGTRDLNKNVTTAVLNSLSLTVNPLKYKGKPLFGWFHLKIQSSDNTFPLTWVFSQGETQYTEAAPAGSFVPLNASNWGKSCQNDQVEKKTSIPCYFVQEPFPLTQYSFGRYTGSRRVNTYSMFFRLDSPLCDVLNSQNGIYFRTFVMNDKTRGKLPAVPALSLITVEDKFYGGADPAPPFHANDVDCSGAIKDADWVKDETPGYNLRNAVAHDTCIDNICFFKNSYEGRCSVNKSAYTNFEPLYWVHPGYTHYCYTLKRSRNDSDWPELGNYVQTVEKYARDCPNCNNTVNFLNNTGIPVRGGIGEFVWASRQGHSVFMVIAVIFLYPVAAFVARFYKETYMNKRVLVNLHFWYSVHIYLSILLAIALINGLALAIYGRKFYGYSLSPAGQAHVVIGYITLLCALIGVASNGIRLRTRGLRYVSIITHCVSGALFYLSSMLSVATSMYVPGSPSGGDDLPPGWEKARDNFPEIELRFPVMSVLLLVWMVFDTAIYIVSMRRFKLSDWRARRKIFPGRRWILGVPIPLLWPESTKDFDGTQFRKFLLMVYILVSGITTVIFVLWLSFMPTDNRNLGKMRYTHGGKFEDIFSLIDGSGDGHGVS